MPENASSMNKSVEWFSKQPTQQDQFAMGKLSVQSKSLPSSPKHPEGRKNTHSSLYCLASASACSFSLNFWSSTWLASCRDKSHINWRRLSEFWIWRELLRIMGRVCGLNAWILMSFSVHIVTTGEPCWYALLSLSGDLSCFSLQGLTQDLNSFHQQADDLLRALHGNTFGWIKTASLTRDV